MVTAEDGSVQIYKVIVVRAKNGNSKLSSISVRLGEEVIDIDDFNPEVLEYTIEVPEGTLSATLEATTELETTTTKFLDSSIISKSGITQKRIMGIAEDGTKTRFCKKCEEIK